MSRKYGWKPARPEQLAHAPKYKVCPRLMANLPSSVDLRSKFPPVFDQGDLGSCTANMSAGMVVYDQAIEGLNVVTPSRLFDYFNSRKLEGSTTEDAGASIADAVKALAQWGFCPESEWPYDISKFADTPPGPCYSDAAPNKITDFFNVNQELNTIKAALAAGEPVGIGIVVYQSFETPTNGMVPLPSLQEQMGQALGGHAILLVGYDDSKQCFIFRNSWGQDWGLNGYAYIPYTYVVNTSLASDFWVIRTIPGKKPTPTPPSPPAPPAPPAPPPSPSPSNIQQVIDDLFVQLEAAVAQSRFGAWLTPLIKNLQAEIDSLFAHSRLCYKASKQGLNLDQIKQVADRVLGILQVIFVGNATVEAILTALRAAVAAL